MPIPVGYAQVNMKFTGAAVPTGAEVTFGVDISSAAFTPTQVAQAVDLAYFNAGIPPLLAADNDETSILVKFGPDATGPSAEEATGNPSSGGAGVGPNTAWLVRKNTALGGRAGRGRMFWPGVPEADVDSAGVLLSSPTVGFQTAMDDFLTELDTAGLPMVLLHGESSPLSTPTPVTSLVVQSRVGTQRRRNRR